jgi:succinate-semialdehyde dehydrogenase/glutarate-semialdehyde dehydrogenase
MEIVMVTLQLLERDLGPVPRGPIVGENVLGGPDTISVIDPATEETIAEVVGGDVDTALLAVDTAQQAMARWTSQSPRQRSDVLRRAYDLMVSRCEALAQLIVLENGKALADARSEVLYAAEFFRWYSEEAVRLTGEVGSAPAGSNRIMVVHKPIGVALLITPWNFPAAMATRKIGPALAAGCAVVLKPASETPLTALALARLLVDAGAPPGVINVVPSRRSDALASRLLDDPRVRKISFTGSTEVGRTLLAHAARTVVNSGMELGGNAPFLVFADADLDAAVAGAMIAKLRNGGSACTAANRFIVHSSIAEDFGARLAVAMSQLTVGPGLDPATDIGPLVNAKTRDKVSHLVNGALDSGAKALVGAEAPDRRGFYYLPTVLTAVPDDSVILGEEIFGPVAPITKFDHTDDAVALANATEYGLVSYIYTTDLRTGLQVGEQLDSGMVGINRPVVSDPAAPFGGTKQSGLGREGGHEGMLEYTETQYLAVDW